MLIFAISLCRKQIEIVVKFLSREKGVREKETEIVRGREKEMREREIV
jgi:hypothetical protein